MKPKYRNALFAVVVISAIMVVFSNVEKSTTPPAPIPDSQPTTQGSGMTAHIDPVTGEFAEPPPEKIPSPGKDGTDVEVVQEPAPGGGVMVVVGDKFHQSMVGTAGDSGNVVIECLHKDQAASGDSTSASSHDERR